jgi:hypothetical protein
MRRNKMLLNEICGKKIINSTTAAFEGIVTGGVVTKCLKKICAFKVGIITVSKSGLRGEKEIYIDPQCILSFKDALVTERIKEIDRPNGEEFLDAPLGTPIFNINGMMYGYLIDMCFNKNFEVTKLVYDRPFGIQKIIGVSGDVIIAKAAMKRGGKNKTAYEGEILYRPRRDVPTQDAEILTQRLELFPAPHLKNAASLSAQFHASTQKNDDLDEKNLSFCRSHQHDGAENFQNFDKNLQNNPSSSSHLPVGLLDFQDENLYSNKLLQNSDMSANNIETSLLNQNIRNSDINIENQNHSKQQFQPHSDISVENQNPSQRQFQPLQSLQKTRRNPAYYFNKYPQKLICGYTFLLGRSVGEDIRNIKNEIIIDRGSIITDDIVEKAGAYGKLVELTFNSIK